MEQLQNDGKFKFNRWTKYRSKSIYTVIYEVVGFVVIQVPGMPRGPLVYVEVRREGNRNEIPFSYPEWWEYILSSRRVHT
jgi:hypothetical protein